MIPTQICPLHFLARHIIEAKLLRFAMSRQASSAEKVFSGIKRSGCCHSQPICGTAAIMVRHWLDVLYAYTQIVQPSLSGMSYYFLLQNPVLCHGTENAGLACSASVRFSLTLQVRIYSVVWVCSPTLAARWSNCLNHPALVQRQIQFLAPSSSGCPRRGRNLSHSSCSAVWKRFESLTPCETLWHVLHWPRLSSPPLSDPPTPDAARRFHA